MLEIEKLLEIVRALEKNEVEPVPSDQIEIMKIIALLEIRDQIDRLGEIIMDFKAELLEPKKGGEG